MSTPATRLLTLIMLLQREPNQKAADLAVQLGVSIRTLHRYFGMLDDMGIPIYAERGPHGGFSLIRGYKLPPLVFSPEEAVALYLGTSLVGQLWGQLYAAPARSVMAKLDNVLPDEQQQEVAWAQRSLLTLGLHRADPTLLAPHLTTIRQALHEQHRLTMHYQNASTAAISERSIDPYAMAHRSGWWYLLGYCHLRQDIRLFRIDRIQNLETLPQTFERPANFDARGYLENIFKDQPGVKARLRFVPEAAHIALSNLSGWELAQENADGSVEVTLSAPDLFWLASLTLSFATWVTVLEPSALQTLVRDWALETAALYPDDPQTERNEE